jgi:ABC-type nitrate/sulfonate/bicarbonate transport system ATPase subunit
VTEKIAVRALGRVFSESHPKTTAFENVSLSVAEGEFVCILGPSGCGKSTFLLCVAGLETPDQGEMLLDGTPIEGPGIERGIVFQEYALFPWRSVIGNVAYGLEVKGLPRSEQIRVARHFKRLGHKARRRMTEFDYDDDAVLLHCMTLLALCVPEQASVRSLGLFSISSISYTGCAARYARCFRT